MIQRCDGLHKNALPKLGEGILAPVYLFKSRLSALHLLAARTADGFLLLNAAQFAFGHMPAFAAHRAKDAALRDRLAEALEQLFLRFVRT
jgi:hypothetical protein